MTKIPETHEGAAEELRELIDRSTAVCNLLLKEQAVYVARIAELEAELRFYGREWQVYYGALGVPVCDEPTMRLMDDAGKRARNALQSVEGV